MHECPRCEYKVTRKWDMINHLNRKKTCKFTKNDTSVIDCFVILNTKKKSNKIIICEYCERKFDRDTRLFIHLTKCKNKQFEQMKQQIILLKNENKLLKDKLHQQDKQNVI